MSRRYKYSTCLSFGTDGEADYCEMDVTVSFSVIWGEPETGPTYACGGTPATGDLVEDIRVESIDGDPVATADPLAEAAILAAFETGDHDADLLAEAAAVAAADAAYADDLRAET
jgi:hypothetical protein